MGPTMMLLLPGRSADDRAAATSRRPGPHPTPCPWRPCSPEAMGARHTMTIAAFSSLRSSIFGRRTEVIVIVSSADRVSTTKRFVDVLIGAKDRGVNEAFDFTHSHTPSQLWVSLCAYHTRLTSCLVTQSGYGALSLFASTLHVRASRFLFLHQSAGCPPN
jgi:hypothetical protein